MGALADSLTVQPLRRSARANQRPELEVILDSLDPDDKQALLSQLTDTAISGRAVAAWLQGFGFLKDHEAPDQAVHRWRRKHLAERAD